MVSRTLVKKETGTVTALAFDAGEGLSEHTAPYDALVFVYNGRKYGHVLDPRTGRPVEGVAGVSLPPGVSIQRTQVWNVVTVTACTKPLNMPFYQSTGFVFESTKYVPNRDRPIAFVLTGGNVPDCIAAELLLPLAPPQTEVLHGDKGHDSDKVRRQIEAQGAAPNIPPKSDRLYKPGNLPALYKNRNAIERSFCRSKDFRRIATRYDKLARNFLAAVHLAATVRYWL